MKNMLNFKEHSKEELQEILNLAMDMKKYPEKYQEILKGKKLYTLFEKTSTRTFLSFTTGITELGGTYYNQLWKDSNFVLGEPVSDSVMKALPPITVFSPITVLPPRTEALE